MCTVPTVGELTGNITVHVAGMGYAALECDNHIQNKPRQEIIHIEPTKITIGGNLF